MKNKGWLAFWTTIPIGILIFLGIYLFTDKLLASIFLGLGIYGVVYYICVGLTVASNTLVEIKNFLLK